MKGRIVFLALVVIALMHAPAHAQIQIQREPLVARAGDLLFFMPRSINRQNFNKLTIDTKMGHMALTAYDKKGVLKIWHVLNNAGSSISSGNPTKVRTGVVADDISSLETDPDIIIIRQKWPPLTIKESTALTAFLEDQLGKPYDKEGALGLAFKPKKLSMVPPIAYDRYFCSQFVVCAIGPIIGPMHIMSYDGKTIKPGTRYPNPEGITPGDFLIDRRTFDLSSRWEDPVIITFPKK